MGPTRAVVERSARRDAHLFTRLRSLRPEKTQANRRYRRQVGLTLAAVRAGADPDAADWSPAHPLNGWDLI